MSDEPLDYECCDEHEVSYIGECPQCVADDKPATGQERYYVEHDSDDGEWLVIDREKGEREDRIHAVCFKQDQAEFICNALNAKPIAVEPNELVDRLQKWIGVMPPSTLGTSAPESESLTLLRDCLQALQSRRGK